jgi:uroporphyrinogen III methyltransferase/synthase
MTTPAEKPLLGKKIVVTRARAQADKLARMLEDLGATVLEFPTIEIEPVQPPPPIPPLHGFDWIIFTSVNGVNAFLDAVDGNNPDLDLRNCRVCAVGPGTTTALRDRGVKVDVTAGDYRQEGVLDVLQETDPLLRGKHILLPKGDLAREFLPEELRKLGATVAELIVYRTISLRADPAAVQALIDAKPDAVTFTSGSTARNFAAMLGPEGLRQLAGVLFAAIGPETAAAARACDIPVYLEPKQHDLGSLARALAKAFTGRDMD